MSVTTRDNLLVAVTKISDALKRRDKREPGRLEKEHAEARLTRIMRRVFRKQAALMRSRLEAAYPDRKAIQAPPINVTDWAWDEDDFAAFLMELIRSTKGGISLFKANQPIIDYTMVNADAAKWAREYAYDFVKNIGETTKRQLQQAIDAFISTPGFTIQDTMDLLGDTFSESRARTVAVTEITRAYARGNQLAGEELKKEFPDVRVVKIWYTNNDDRVCDICAPLDGMEVGIDEFFTTEDDKSVGIDPPAHVNCRCWTDYTTVLGEE